MAKCNASGVDASGVAWECDREANGDGRRTGVVMCQMHRRNLKAGRLPLMPIRPQRPKSPTKGCDHDPNDLLCDVPPGHRRCCRCRAVKPISAYTKRRDAPLGIRAECKSCSSLDAKDKLYGPGAGKWFVEQLARQGGKCAFCPPGAKPVMFDHLCLHHDHNAPPGPDSWRLVLCTPCNMMLEWRERGHDMRYMVDAMEQHGY